MHDLHLAYASVERLVGRPVADVERDLILETLRQTGGNRTHAANLLGIAIRTLRNKINLYQADGYTVPEPPQSAAGHEGWADATFRNCGRQ
ncbi:helix-turn-helix domain-containing protein [Bosea beijingensis]